MRSILLWGAGGHGKVVLDIVLATGQDFTIVFYDDDPARTGALFCGYPVLSGPVTGFDRFVVSIGDNRMRAQCFERVRQSAAAAILIHPSAVVSPAATLGPGTVVMPQAVVNAGAWIGPNCIVNTAAVVEHDCRVGAHVHLSPGSVIGGGSVIEEYAQVGIRAAVLPGLRVGRGALAGGGAVVVRDVPPGAVVVGVPARTLRQEAA